MIQIGADWWPAVAMLAAGLVVGAIVARRLLRRSADAAPSATDRELADLVARRDTLIEQLQDPRTQNRAALELEAAQVLREIDHATMSVAPSPPGPLAPSPAPTSPLRGFLWGAATVAALAFLVFFVTRSTTRRSEGEPVTGDAAANAGAPEADLARLEQAVRQNPNDLEARLDLARAYLVRERFIDVFQQTQYVLEREPDSPRALSYQAIVRLAMGEPQTALQMLQRALARDPDSIEARVHLALVYATTGNTSGAVEAIEETIRRHPEERERLSGLIEQIRSRASETDRVELIVELAPGVKASPGGILFVIARPQGVTEGAPIAVKRLSVSSFPLRVTLGPEDSMMGGKLSERLRIDVRIDSDGDPLTRSDSDPRASVDGVELGATGVRLLLR